MVSYESPRSLKGCLAFIHIPKAMGGSIERPGSIERSSASTASRRRAGGGMLGGKQPGTPCQGCY